MNAIDHEGQGAKDRSSHATLLVLGMHRSGTSAITGSLGYSGAWVGEEAELTIANVENPQGFWERRDVRELCDRLLLAAGADWWKIADFDPKAIPRATLAEQRRKFKRIVSALNEYATWTVKEPRLCLLLPVLRDYCGTLSAYISIAIPLRSHDLYKPATVSAFPRVLLSGKPTISTLCTRPGICRAF